ncbi:MAG: membrane protein insertion efficiency factor YidD [Candidatus Lindowbacteria bacterium RIFCSPLOWO2_12_FULL_62_27]|nr:MAG: membrane protein insertion efficiency factor YidD [Candidatus Lindowbacteria bacterium RIFCSPLOWO2_02_FULL_62_12]OGH62978.1 MAG: membrane protein insertion efficiency factor YidD [Candidatus Lindowbacteria bacterium RIFCSPLOWO2_12_FULL_62_27]
MAARVLLLLIRIYAVAFRPLTAMWGGCRFYPTCSDYASETIRRRGAVRGLGSALWRLLRCHPLSRGGVDLP